MPDEISIRRMTLNDIDAVLIIEQEAFAHPLTRENFEHDLTQNVVARYLVAEKENRVIGYAGAWVVLDEGQVTNIAFLKDERGKGYGKQLVSALLQYVSNLGASYITLEVRESNTVARHLYTSLGFFNVGRRKKYYEDNGEDALVMACDHLPPADPDFEEAETLHLDEEKGSCM